MECGTATTIKNHLGRNFLPVVPGKQSIKVQREDTTDFSTVLLIVLITPPCILCVDHTSWDGQNLNQINCTRAATGRPTLNLERRLDHDGHPLAITTADAVAASGVPPWNWRETPGNGNFVVKLSSV